MSELISIVIPVYNSQNSLFELYKRIKKAINGENFKFELILVDDSSSDKSYQKIIDLSRKDKRVKGIRLAQNFGQQNAIFCGFNYAQGDYIITMDDDMQHQAEDIVKLYKKIKDTDYDAVYAIPKNRDYSLVRKIGSKLTDKLFNLITPKTNNFRVSSFRIINRNLLQQILHTDKSFIYISAIMLQQKIKIANIYTEQKDRKYGESNYNFFKLIKLFFKLFLYYSEIPFLEYFRSKDEQYLVAEKTFNWKNKI